ncbi:hypothetical protein Oweho_1347 [Owenweeksia hongkongensis DSM 17368]|uniref:Uncharacterized protein n=1 Tax=Owenweeksia hongkongensis (strain DSM 17368 / CIP 108786 / JCM 12287 / NRRL B-23963 / UST20020801) TaxID=926562 RepID=G8R7J1_OWEHD|nr:hypothetical protein Oweho_1347 [Owenweeksia hongkongensis DSM 17368]
MYFRTLFFIYRRIQWGEKFILSAAKRSRREPHLPPIMKESSDVFQDETNVKKPLRMISERLFHLIAIHLQLSLILVIAQWLFVSLSANDIQGCGYFLLHGNAAADHNNAFGFK